MSLTIEQAFQNVVTCVDAFKCNKAERVSLDESLKMLADKVLHREEKAVETIDTYMQEIAEDKK